MWAAMWVVMRAAMWVVMRAAKLSSQYTRYHWHCKSRRPVTKELSVCEAAGSTGADTITITRTGTLAVNASLPNISGDIAIEANGFSVAGDDRVRIFNVQSAHPRIDRLAMSHGRGVLNDAGSAISVGGGRANASNRQYIRHGLDSRLARTHFKRPGSPTAPNPRSNPPTPPPTRGVREGELTSAEIRFHWRPGRTGQFPDARSKTLCL